MDQTLFITVFESLGTYSSESKELLLKVSKIILSPAHFLQINLHILAMLTHKLGTSLSELLRRRQLCFL